MKTAIKKIAAMCIGFSVLSSVALAQDVPERYKCPQGQACKQLQQYPAANEIPENPIKNFGKSQNSKQRLNAPATRRWATVRYS